MSVPDILNELSRRGIDIELTGGKIRLHGSKNDLDKPLVESIKSHKAEIMTALSGGTGIEPKGRPIWCTECQHGGYKTDEDTGSQVLWCKFSNQTILDMQKCIKGYWMKNGQGFPITVH